MLREWNAWVLGILDRGRKTGEVMAAKRTDCDYVDLYEQLLYQRAAQGIRPVLYISSLTDLECSMLMLLDEDAEARYADSTQPNGSNRLGYHVVTN